MSAHPTTLFELFGDFTELWPVEAVQDTTGAEQADATEIVAWLAALNAGAKLSNIRLGAIGGHAAIEADVSIDNAFTGYPDGFPVVLRAMPDVEFRLLNGGRAKLFVSVDAAGIPEVLIEGAPVEIRLPIGLVEPHPGPADHPSTIASQTVGSFSAGTGDDLQITYNNAEPTTIRVHVRFHMTPDGEFSLRTAVPISFGRCLFSAIPCKAVHDFSLIPSPGLIPRTVDWIRFRDLGRTDAGAPDIGAERGAFGVRSIHLDMAAAPLKSAANWLNGHADEQLPAEFVLDDLVMPFLGLPRHFTVGMRRGIIDPKDPKQSYFFDKAPFLLHFSRDPSFGLTVESLFVQIPALKEAVGEDDPTLKGITLAASLFYAGESTATPKPGEGEPKPLSPHAVELSLGENLTPRVTYRRAFDAVTGLPASGEGAARRVNALLHHVIADISIDVMALRVGLSLSKFFGDDAEGSTLDKLEASGEATFDVFVSARPFGDDDSFFKLRGLDGEKIAFAIEGIGWRQGSATFGSGLPELPNGVAIFVGPVKIIVQEIGLLADRGATYLSITAGVDTPLPKGLRGSVVLKRARFKLSGVADAPKFLLDGFFVRLQSGTLLIEAGGFYTERTEGDVQVSEFGLSGKAQFRVGQTDHGLSLDLLVGSIRTATERFRYFMAQAVYRSVLLASFELRNIRLLFANNLQPKLQPADAAAGTLRYFNWHRQTNPLSVPGDRRLSGWRPQDDAWTLGIGCGGSLPALGKICELNVFILVVDGPDESGALFTGELTALSNPKPLGFFALDADNKTDRVSFVIGVDVKLPDFLKDPPEWSRNIGQLSGTLFISNKPGTFALGRLADQRTWLTLQFDVDFFLKSSFKFAFCFETTSGASGVGFIVSVEGGFKCGNKFQLTYIARFAISAGCFATGSSDGALTVSIELAARVALFRIIRLGVSLLAELRYIVANPTRTEAMLRFRFETPWFLPDVTWTLDLTFGRIELPLLATAVSPLRVGAAMEGPGRANASLHLARFAIDDPAFDPDWDGSGTAPTFSISQFSGPGAAEAVRIARFEADQAVRPIAIDSTIAIDWNVAVNDQLSLGAAIASDLGSQSSGELDLTYDLVGIKVRRRARFGLDRSWRDLEEIQELAADFSDPNGIGLEGEYGPQTLTKVWDHDLRIGSQTAAKRLLINGSTPFSFTTGDNEVDEETIAGNPNWPCCPPKDKDGVTYTVHFVEFRNEPPGRRIVGDRIFTESESRLAFLRPAIVRPAQSGTLTPPNAVIAFLVTATPGPFLRVEFDEAAAFCALRMAWGRAQGVLELVGFDSAGAIVARLQLPLGPASAFQDVVLTAKGPMHRMEARLQLPRDLAPAGGTTIHVPPGTALAIEIDRVSYVGLRAYLDDLRFHLACLGVEGDGPNGYSGHGKLFFLPNHDYEIALTTRLTIAHPSKPPESANVTEHVYFRTKGLPGLNAAGRPGEEVEPYVAAAYDGGKGLLYREEPAVLAFTESFLVAVPLASRPAGTSEEAATLHQLQLLVEPNTAATPETVVTATARDWIVEHRGTVPPIRNHWVSVLSQSLLEATPMRSQDPFRLRLARLTQRSQTDCQLADPLDITGSVLLAPPQGQPHPSLPNQEIWPAASGMTAVARAKGAAFVDRRPFEPADRTALRFATMTGPDTGALWTVADGHLKLEGATGRAFASFGDGDWNHLTIRSEIRFDRSAGVGVALPQTTPTEGLFATLERNGAAVELAIYSRVAGGSFAELARSAVSGAPGPETAVVLRIDAFDDRLRATALDTVVEVDRNAFRDGRVALFGEGQATFVSLVVHGLDIFRFPFTTSRFVSFADHIGSFAGSAAVAHPNDLGAGTTTATVAELWAATRAEIATLMQPDAVAADRQDLFDRWVIGLGLPVCPNVLALALTSFVEGAQPGLMLLESSEPLDFTGEVSLELARMQNQVQPRGAPLPAEAARPSVGALAADRNLAARRALVGRTPRRLPSLALPERPTPVILSMTAIEGGYRVELDAAALAAAGSVEDEINIGERSRRGLVFFKGRLVRPPRARRIFVDVLEDSVIPIAGTTPPIPIIRALMRLALGTFALLSSDLTEIVDTFLPPQPEPPIELTVLQDGAGLRALLIPHQGATHRPLDAGTYELRFAMDRERWPTQAPSAGSRYQSAATLTVKV
jgi:hypothetical protein